MTLRLPLPRSASYRIAIIGLLFYICALVPLGIGVSYATHAALLNQMDTSITQLSTTLSNEYRTEGAAGVMRVLTRLRSGGPVPQGAALFTADGHMLGGNIDTTLPPLGWQKISLNDPQEGPDPARALVSRLPDGNRLVVAADLEALEAINRTLFGMFGLATLALLVLGAGTALLLARYLHRRLAPITTTADAVIAGNLQHRAEIGHTHDEFDRVANSLNAMLSRVATLVENLRQVSADLAHDLRTPLVGLRNQLERMRGEEDMPLKQARIEHALDRTDEVLALFDAILRIAEVDAGHLTKSFTTIDVSTLLNDLSDSAQAIAEDCAHTFTAHITTGLYVSGDRQLLAQAVLNLLENALRHTPAGTHVGLSAMRKGNIIQIDVRDNGLGIPIADHHRVRQRFVRLEASRSTPGHGLGLSLVDAIAQAHAGQLHLVDAQPGLLASLQLPCESAP